MLDIFDLGDPRYIAQVMPELHPEQPQPRLANWSTEEREVYCGEYAKTAARTYVEHGKVYCGEWLGTARIGSAATGAIWFRSGCGYPFGPDGECTNRLKHRNPLACLDSPTHPAS